MDSEKKKWIETYAKIGFASKGIVYFITGSLTADFALNMGGQKASNKESLLYISNLPGGNFLLGILAVGLLGYSVLKLTQALRDTENKGTEAKGLAKRVAYAFSGLIYLSLSYVAIKIVLSSSNVSDGNSQSTIIAKVMSLPLGDWIVMMVGIITIGNGIYQLKKGITGSFMKDVSGLSYDQRRLLKNTGKAGFISRGIVFSIIGFLVTKAGWLHNAAKTEGTSGAFSFLLSWPHGDLLLAGVAIGLMAYGVFMFVQAKYSNISIS